MPLTLDELWRGFLCWSDANHVVVISSPAANAPPGSTTDYVVETSGSVAPVRPSEEQWIRLVPSGLVTSPPASSVRWVALDDEGKAIVTRIWQDLTAPPIRLPFVPNLGFFHRLVVATPLLAISDSFALQADDLIVRYINGATIGERAPGVEHVEIASDGVSFETGRIGTVQVEGQFLEITAPGPTPAAAELAAFATLGFLAICLGDHAVGPIVFSTSFDASPERVQCTLRLGLPGLTPWPVEEVSIPAAEQHVADVRQVLANRPPIAIALRWYEQGIRSARPLDQLLGFFVGIEALIIGFCAEHGELPVTRERRERHKEFLEEVAGKVTAADLNSIRSRLLEPSLLDLFRFFAQQHGLDPAAESVFKRVRRARNDVFHGATVEVDSSLAEDARRLLMTLLRIELGIPGSLPWDESSRVGAFTFIFDYAATGHLRPPQGTPPGDIPVVDPGPQVP